MLSVEHLGNYKRKGWVCLPVALTDLHLSTTGIICLQQQTVWKAGVTEDFLPPTPTLFICLLNTSREREYLQTFYFFARKDLTRFCLCMISTRREALRCVKHRQSFSSIHSEDLALPRDFKKGEQVCISLLPHSSSPQEFRHPKDSLKHLIPLFSICWCLWSYIKGVKVYVVRVQTTLLTSILRVMLASPHSVQPQERWQGVADDAWNNGKQFFLLYSLHAKYFLVKFFYFTCRK